MFDWSDKELGNVLWSETSEADDHIVPFTKGNEGKPPLTFGDPKKKQYTQEARPVKAADHNVSGSNSLFSFSKPESRSECNTKEAVLAPGADIDSWPDSPLTNVACDGNYAGSNVQDSINLQTSDFETEILKYDPAKGHTPALFGNECKDKEHSDFLEYSWDNIGSFDDLDSMFRNDDPIFGRDLGNGELWASSTNLFSSPTKSFPICSPSSGLDDLCMPEHDVKVDNVQLEDPSHVDGFGKTEHIPSHDLKIGVRKDSIGGKSTSLPEEKANLKMIERAEGRKIRSTGKVNGKRKLLKCPTKEEKERSSLDWHASWPITADQFQSFGNQLTSSVQSIQSSVSPQKQPMGLDSLSYWQTSHPYLSEDSNVQLYPMISTSSNAHSVREKNQHVHHNLGNSPHVKSVFSAPSRPPAMSPQEKLEKLKRRQQLQAMLAIKEQQQQFGQKSSHTDVCNAEKTHRGNPLHDIEGSTIEVEENLKLPPFMRPNTPMGHDSHTSPMLNDDCSLQERALEKLQDVVGKLDVKVRLCIRDSLFRLAQSAMQRHNTETSSADNSMQCDGVAENDESYGRSRLSKLPEVETDTNPIDRTMAHLLFHQPLESSTKPAKGCEIPASPGYAKFLGELNTEGIKNSSLGHLPNHSIDKQSLSQASCVISKSKNVENSQSYIYLNTPEKASKSEPEAHRQ